MSSQDHDRGTQSGPPQSPVTPGAVPDAGENTTELPATSTLTTSNNQSNNSSLTDSPFLRRPSSKSNSTSEGRVHFLGAAAKGSRFGPGRDDDHGLSMVVDDSNEGLSMVVADANTAGKVVSFPTSNGITRTDSSINRGGSSSVHDTPMKGTFTQGIRESGIGSGSGVGAEVYESDGRRSNHPLTPAPRLAGEKSKMIQGDGSVSSGTFKYQAKLPKLQVPPLEDTLSRYLLAVQSLLSPEAFSRTKAVVEEFKTKGEGQALQQALVDYSADKDSYIEEFWDDSYLTPNSSIVLNLNPFFVFETPTLSTHTKDGGDDVNGGDRTRHLRRETDRTATARGYDGDVNAAAAAVVGNKQASRAASLLFSSLRFAAAVKSETLPPDIWRNNPLCMNQFRRLFGAHRKAVENDADEMKICEDSTHVVVLCANQFYWFRALHVDGRVGVTEHELDDIMLAIQEDASKANLAERAALAVGVLSTETRDEWAVSRKKLASSGERNKRYLQIIDTALFVLCLDHTSPSTAAEIASACLHGSNALEGDIQIGTCTNRWYDKLQLIVFENGAAGVNFEHTWVDGHTVLRFASDVFADVIYRFANHITSTTGSGRDGLGTVFPPDEHPFSPCEGRTPKKMEWRLSPELRKAVYFAETRLSDLIRQHDVQTLEYATFGKRFITANKMSPDGLVQMGVVYAYYALYGNVVSAYEPVLTKMFLKGRTEALRTVTMEVKAFLETFSDPETSKKQKMLSLRSAIVSHGRLVKLAAKGKGFDRHLFALLCLAKRRLLKGDSQAIAETGNACRTCPRIPALFEDEAWRTLNHVVLSTSNCGNPSLRLFGFGPVVRNGFGVGYIIKENQLQLVATSKNRQTDRFVCKIKQFFDKVYEAYSPAQIRGRVRVSSAVDGSDDTRSYSM